MAESETPFPPAVPQALSVFLCLFLPSSEGLIFHTPPTQDWATVTGTKFSFVCEQPQSLQIWDRILAQDDHIKDPDFFLSLQRKKHTVQGEAV